MDRRTWSALGLIALTSLLYRLTLPSEFLELDGSVYIRAAADYARHFASGDWTRTPLTNASYTAIEYWPPLFPLLSGLLCLRIGDPESAARAVSFIAGWVLLIPAFALASRFWGPRAGLVAAGVVGFYPLLAWFARVPRATSLYLLLYVSAVGLALGAAWRPERRVLHSAAAGVMFALAYMTRFETFLPLALCTAGMVVMAMHRKGAERASVLRGAGAMLVAFLIAAAPYLTYLASLNGGRPTLISPEKRMYDTMEGFWTVIEHRSMRAFTKSFGVPGMVRVDPDDPAMRAYFEGQLDMHLPTLLGHGLRELPASFRAASSNWLPILVALAGLGALTGLRDPRVQALLVMLLQDPAMAVLTSWDPNPRYYSFTIPLLVWLACPAVLAIWDGRLSAPLRLRPLLAYGLLPFLVFLAWRVPGPQHFDVRYVTDPCVLTFIADPPRTRLLLLAVACLAGGACACFPRLRPLAGPAAGVAAAQVVVASVDLQGVGMWRYTAHVPLSLALLAVSLAVAGVGRWLQEVRAKDEWGRQTLKWIAACSLLVAVQSSAAMAFIDRAYAGGLYDHKVRGWLQSHPEVRRVVSPHPYDAFRAGREWVPCDEFGHPSSLAAMVESEADALVLPQVGHATAGHALTVVAVADPRLRLVSTLPGPREYCQHAWVIYKKR